MKVLMSSVSQLAEMRSTDIDNVLLKDFNLQYPATPRQSYQEYCTDL